MKVYIIILLWKVYHKWKVYIIMKVYIIIWQVYNATEDVKAKNAAQCNIHMQATPHMLTTTLMYVFKYIS